MTDSPASQAPRREVIVFQVGPQEFCVDIMAVRELRGWTPATPLPRSPDYVLGVINLRGTVLPVVDMSARLGLGPGQTGGRQVIIVVFLGRQLVGLLVDSVREILALDEAQLRPTPDLPGQALEGFVDSLITLQDRMVGVLTLERLLPELAEAA